MEKRTVKRTVSHEEDRRAVLENLTATLGQALALGTGDLLAEQRAQLDQALGAGARIEFVILCAPLHLRCFVTSPDLQTRELIFEVETEKMPNPESTH